MSAAVSLLPVSSSSADQQHPDVEIPELSSIAAGFHHSFVIGRQEDKHNLTTDTEYPEDGEDKGERIRGAFAFGATKHRLLGPLQKRGGSRNAEVEFVEEPTALDFFKDHPVAQVGCGSHHTVFLQKSAGHVGGKVYACGLGTNGRLGVNRPKDILAARELLEASRSAFGGQDFPQDQRSLKAMVEPSQPKWCVPCPVLVSFPNREDKIAYIACGADHTLAVTVRGGVCAWGSGSYGNLGNGSTDDSWIPVVAELPAEVRCCMVAAGSKHSMALTATGDLYSWGHGDNGRLGLGPQCAAALVPRQIERPGLYHMQWIAAGEAHSASIDQVGNVFTWGAGSYGRTGHGADMDTPLPELVTSLLGNPCKTIALGTLHSLALNNKGEVYVWGAGSATGVLLRNSTEVVVVPKLLGEGHPPFIDGLGPALHARPVLQIAAGAFHSLALQKGGRIYAWGNGGHGRLGVDHANQPGVDHASSCKEQWFPMMLTNLRGQEPPPAKHSDHADFADTRFRGTDDGDLKTVSSGGMHSAVITRSGELWTWGCGESGQSGQSRSEDVWEPTLTDLPSNRMKIKTVALGLEHALAISEDGVLVAWGRNHCGQLGFGTTKNCSTPQVVHGMLDVAAIGAGEDHSAAVTSSGNLFSWGFAECGKLGHGSGLSGGMVQVPRKVRFESMVVAVHCGSQHTAVIDIKGLLFTFGLGWFGRLGHGDMANQSSPKRVETFVSKVGAYDATQLPAEPVKMVQCANYHTAVVTRDSKVYVCGRDTMVCSTNHQAYFLCIDSMREVDGGEVKVVAVAAARQHTLVLSDRGTLYGWGDNRSGVLGIGETEDQFVAVPKMMPPMKAWRRHKRQIGVAEISTGDSHSFALLENGDLYAWGLRSGGRLGLKAPRFSEDSSKIVWAPTRVKPVWQDETALEKYEEKENQGDEEGENGALSEAPSTDDEQGMIELPVLQKKLQNENTKYTVEGLEKWQERISVEYHAILDNIRSLWDEPTDKTGRHYCEWTLRDLQNRLDKSVCQNVRRLGLGDEYPSIETFIHDEVAERMIHYEELMWILQQQPCYLARLSEKLKAKENTVLEGIANVFKGMSTKVPIEDVFIPHSLFPRVTRNIFRDLEDCRTRNLYVALLRRLVRIEAEACYAKHKNFDQLFDPEKSLVQQLFYTFITANFLRPFHRLIFDASDPNSLIALLVDWTHRDGAKVSSFEDQGDSSEKLLDALFAMHSLQLAPFEQLAVRKGLTVEEMDLGRKLEDQLKVFCKFLAVDLVASTRQVEVDAKKGYHVRSDSLAAFLNRLKKWPACMDCVLNVFAKAAQDMVDIVHRDSSETILLYEGETEARKDSKGRLSEAKQLQMAQQYARQDEVLKPLARLWMGGVFGYLLMNYESLMTSEDAKQLQDACERKLKMSDEGARHKRSPLDEIRIKSLVRKVHFNLQNLGTFFTFAASGSFPDCHQKVILIGNILRTGYILQYMKDIVTQVEDSKSGRKTSRIREDVTQAGLTIDLYQSHYELRERHVCLSTPDLLMLSNALWVFQDHVIGRHIRSQSNGKSLDEPLDHLLDLLNKIQPRMPAIVQGFETSPTPGPRPTETQTPREWTPRAYIFSELSAKEAERLLLMARTWSPSIIGHAIKHGTNHNFIIPHRFLEFTKEFCFCQECDAPIPRFLAPPSQRYIMEVRMVRPFRPIEGKIVEGRKVLLDLANVMRSSDIPIFKSKDLNTLRFEVEQMQQRINDTMQALPAEKRDATEFRILQDLDGAVQGLELMKLHKITLEDFADFVSDSFQQRKGHFKYLQKAEAGISIITKTKSEYVDKVTDRIKTLQKIVECSQALFVPTMIRQKANDSSARLKFQTMEAAKRREDRSKRAYTTLDVDNLPPSMTFSLYNLRAKGVIARMGTGNERLTEDQYKYLYFCFSGLASGDWNIEVLHKYHGKEQRLFEFSVLQKDLDRMKRAGKTAKMPFNDGFVIINCFSLVQLLSRIVAM